MTQPRFTLKHLETLEVVVAKPGHRIVKPEKPGSAPGPIKAIAEETKVSCTTAKKRCLELEIMGYFELVIEDGQTKAVVAATAGIERSRDEQANAELEDEPIAGPQPRPESKPKSWSSATAGTAGAKKKRTNHHACDFTNRPLREAISAYGPRAFSAGA